MISNVPDLAAGRLEPAAGGAMSAAGRKARPVEGSIAMVRALFLVGIVAATTNLSGVDS